MDSGFNEQRQHTVKSYDQDLKFIASNINKILELVLESIDLVTDLIENHPNTKKDFLTDILAHDYKINTLESLIEKKITSILALRQPMAIDLRYIVSSIKVSSSLERMGDQCKNTVRKIHRMPSLFDESEKKSLVSMINISKSMVKDAVNAFNNHDVVLADKVLKTDDTIDEIYHNLFGMLEHESFTKERIKYIVNVLFIAKSFERFGDHSTNIAEIAKYVVTSEATIG